MNVYFKNFTSFPDYLKLTWHFKLTNEFFKANIHFRRTDMKRF